MSGYHSDKLQRREHLEISFVPPTGHPGTIDDRIIACFIFQFFQREGIADDVLSKVFYPFLILCFDSHFIMYVALQNTRISTFTKSKISKVLKAGDMSPGHKHLDESIIDQPLFLQHLQHMNAEEFT